MFVYLINPHLLNWRCSALSLLVRTSWGWFTLIFYVHSDHWKQEAQKFPQRFVLNVHDWQMYISHWNETLILPRRCLQHNLQVHNTKCRSREHKMFPTFSKPFRVIKESPGFIFNLPISWSWWYLCIKMFPNDNICKPSPVGVVPCLLCFFLMDMYKYLHISFVVLCRQSGLMEGRWWKNYITSNLNKAKQGQIKEKKWDRKSVV